MDGQVRDSLITAFAPVMWGSTYFVTQEFLPPDRPLFGGVIRALPVGIAMVAVRRKLPQGAWWWKTLVLGTLTIGAFFALLYIVSLRLPGGLAATLMATSPIVLMLLAWPIVGERPRSVAVVGGVIGFVGVLLLVLQAGFAVDLVGVLASLLAMFLAQVGFVLTKRWGPPVDGLTFAGWQLTAGGLFLLPLAVLIEGTPPDLSTENWLGFAYLSIPATGIAYVAWLRGLHLLPAGTVGLIGLINPVVGVLIGVFFAGEVFGLVQLLGVLLVLSGVLAGQPATWARLARRRPRLHDAAGHRDPADHSRPRRAARPDHEGRR